MSKKNATATATATATIVPAMTLKQFNGGVKNIREAGANLAARITELGQFAYIQATNPAINNGQPAAALVHALAWAPEWQKKVKDFFMTYTRVNFATGDNGQTICLNMSKTRKALPLPSNATALQFEKPKKATKPREPMTSIKQADLTALRDKAAKFDALPPTAPETKTKGKGKESPIITPQALKALDEELKAWRSRHDAAIAAIAQRDEVIKQLRAELDATAPTAELVRAQRAEQALALAKAELAQLKAA